METLSTADQSKQRVQFGQGSIYIIQKNSQKILDSVVEDIKNFIQKDNDKYKSLTILYYLLEATGNKLCTSTNTDKILWALYKQVDNESEDLRNAILDCANLLGLVFDQNILIPLMLKHLLDSDVKNTFKILSGRLSVFASVVRKITNISKDNVIEVFNALHELDVFGINTRLDDTITLKQIFYSVFILFSSLVENLNVSGLITDFHSDLFYPLLLLQSLPILSSGVQNEAAQSLYRLSEACGFKTIDGLYALELKFILEKFSKTQKQWRRNSPDRFAFDTYVRNAGRAIESGDNWIYILEILSSCSEPERDIEMRIDMMILLNTLISDDETNSQIKFFGEFLLEHVLLPASAWRAQRPNYKVRKAAMVCLIKMFQLDLLELKISEKYFSQFIVLLKSASDDDWDCELRNLAIKLADAILDHSHKIMNEENIREIYPILLKRLDDSQDVNRKNACNVLVKIFKVIEERVKVSESIVDYILQISFIHLDDPKEEIRSAVFNYLEIALRIDKYKRLWKKHFEEANLKFQHKDAIEKLLALYKN